MFSCCRMLSERSAGACMVLLLFAVANAQPSTPAGQETRPAVNIRDSWDSLLKDTIPQSAPDATLTAAQAQVEATPVGDFRNHFFMNSRTEYLRTQTYFTGSPTVTGVIDAPPGTTFNPAGIPYPPAFQSSTNVIYSFLNWGTRGWLSDRVNSHFSFGYSQDLTNVTPASPQLSIIDTFGSNRRLELVSGYVDINGRPTDGFFAGTHLRLGRQDVYGAELAEMDGASFTMDRSRYSWTLYGGRRFTYFSDPDQRAMGGGNFVFRLGENSSLEYDAFCYIKTTHLFRYWRTLGSSWLFNAGFRMVGSAPIDFSSDAAWNPADGKTSLRLSFAQKITNNDYFYDYTFNQRGFTPPLVRLNLEALHPHSQFVIDASRAIGSRLRLGGSIWVRRLNDTQDIGPFDTSFEDYRAHAQVFPWSKIDLLFEFHDHESDRPTSPTPTQFDDLHTTGETNVQDYSLEIGHSFMEGRLNLRAGGFYRVLDFRGIFTAINDARDKGVLANASFKLNSRTRFYLDYDLDTDYIVFRPDIQNSQTFRFGLAWSY